MAWIIEGVGAALAIAYLLLALKQNKLCWFAWIASSILYLYVMYQAGLYMESLLQVFYLCMGFYGLSQWSKTINNNQNTYVDLWSIGNHIFAISLVIVLSFLSGTLLSNFSNAALPFIDAFTTWGAIVASYMVAKKILENWIYWFIIDFISVFIFASRGLYFTSALFVTYLVIIYFGYKSWSKIRLNQNESIA
ncbi:MAG: nicotinamide riboside transporter PnuC [Gammaproteobacteria bacterium]|jgi:nicotinamide mononucleotide transporter